MLSKIKSIANYVSLILSVYLSYVIFENANSYHLELKDLELIASFLLTTIIGAIVMNVKFPGLFTTLMSAIWLYLSSMLTHFSIKITANTFLSKDVVLDNVFVKVNRVWKREELSDQMDTLIHNSNLEGKKYFDWNEVERLKNSCSNMGEVKASFEKMRREIIQRCLEDDKLADNLSKKNGHGIFGWIVDIYQCAPTTFNVLGGLIVGGTSLALAWQWYYQCSIFVILKEKIWSVDAKFVEYDILNGHTKASFDSLIAAARIQKKQIEELTKTTGLLNEQMENVIKNVVPVVASADLLKTRTITLINVLNFMLESDASLHDHVIHRLPKNVSESWKNIVKTALEEASPKGKEKIFPGIGFSLRK